MFAISPEISAFFGKIYRLYDKSRFAAERQFEQLTLMQKMMVARAADVEFRRHLRDYDSDEQRKIGKTIQQLKGITGVFIVPVTVNDFLNIDYEVRYED